MRKLENKIELKNIGYPVTAILLSRTKKKAIYYRNDGCYEVFKISISPAATIFGKDYPEREVYPGNEDFGFSAWCIRDEKKAYERYNNL
jgi:hypothetical protein